MKLHVLFLLSRFLKSIKYFILQLIKYVRGSLHLFLVHLLLILDTGVLILLVLRDKIVHVRLSFRELHLVHTFSCVPMQECFSSEHGRELFTNSLEHLLYSRGITQEGYGHLQTFWRNITN
jgi:hypothetical protein